jgi:hypothetical protein
LSSQSSAIAYFPGFVFPVTLMSRLLPLLIRTGRGRSLEPMTRTSPRCEQPAITASFPPSWWVHLGTTRSVAVGAAGLAMAALAAIVAVSHIEVLAVTAATAAAKVRFNLPPD